MDGKFTLKLPYAEAPLVFSYLGYQPQEIVPGAKKELTVLLQEDTKALQEVVVVGYTKQRKETMIGSVATITTKDLTQSPTANINIHYPERCFRHCRLWYPWCKWCNRYYYQTW